MAGFRGPTPRGDNLVLAVSMAEDSVEAASTEEEDFMAVGATAVGATAVGVTAAATDSSIEVIQ